MAQQKMLIAVCVFAGFVALVAGQNRQQQATDCTANIQKELSTYSTQLQELVTGFSTKLTQNGASGFDVDGLQRDIQKLVEKYSLLADPSSGFDPQRAMKIANEIAVSQFEIYTKYLMNTELSLSAVNNAMQLGSSLMRLNTGLGQKLMAACTFGSQ